MSALKQWIERRREEPKQRDFGPIGVYFTRERLQIVQLQRLSDGSVGIRSHQSLVYPGDRSELLAAPKAVRKLVRRAMRNGDFQGRKVVSAMPSEQAKVMSVSYPMRASDKDAASIAKLMADRLDGALEDYVLDYLPIRKSSRDGERLALVAVSTAVHVNHYLRMLDAAGLHVDNLEIAPLAIKRLIGWHQAGAQAGNIVVISFGAATSRLTTISGNRLLADQEVQFGEVTILDALASSLQLTRAQARALLVDKDREDSRAVKEVGPYSRDAESTRLIAEIVKPVLLNLVREIERAFLFADSESHGSNGRDLFITGELAQWPGIAKLLGTLSKMTVEGFTRSFLPTIIDDGASSSIDDAQAADMSIAIGLALRGIVGNG